MQRNKSFDPHLLVVPVGSVVAFPNRDPFFHNVFSLFEGKRFDLGLYEAGSTRDVHFDKPGISYIFCNIHPEMSAVVVALDTPYYGISDQHGQVVITRMCPAGSMRFGCGMNRLFPDTLKGDDSGGHDFGDQFNTRSIATDRKELVQGPQEPLRAGVRHSGAG